MNTPAPLRERLERRMVTAPESGCWLWTGSTNNNGYGQIWDGERVVLCHRAAYAEFVGPIPEGMEVLHRCDTPACFNPAHLFLGTHADNMADMAAKGRSKTIATVKGEEVHLAKLTEADVIELRRRAANGESRKALAENYRITKPNVGYIVRRQTWKHI